MNLLWNFVAEAAAERGIEPFLTDLRTRITMSYADLLRQAAAVAGFLKAKGVGAGDRVAYVTKNNPRFFPLLLGCAHRGASLVPLNEDSSPAETLAALGDCAPALVLSDQAQNPEWTTLADAMFEDGSPWEPANGRAERDAI